MEYISSTEYEPIHPPNAITDNLPPEKQWVWSTDIRFDIWHLLLLSLGLVDASTVEKVEVLVTDAEKDRIKRMETRPPLSEILNLHDFEAIAKLVMPEKAWAYYSSAADDEITNRENHMAYHRYVDIS